MNKNVAQLYEDYGVNGEGIVDSAFSANEVAVSDIKAATGFDVSGGSFFTVDLSDESGDVTVASLVNMIPGKEYVFVAYNGAAKKYKLVFTGAKLNPATLTLANGDTIVYKAITDGTKVFIDWHNFA